MKVTATRFGRNKDLDFVHASEYKDRVDSLLLQAKNYEARKEFFATHWPLETRFRLLSSAIRGTLVV